MAVLRVPRRMLCRVISANNRSRRLSQELEVGVQREAFVPRQPALHGRGLVGGVVVDDQMQIEIGGSLAVDLFEEVQELLGPMAGQAFADDRASRDIESRKERRGAVALVIMGHGSGPALLQGQARLRAVECPGQRHPLECSDHGRRNGH